VAIVWQDNASVFYAPINYNDDAFFENDPGPLATAAVNLSTLSDLFLPLYYFPTARRLRPISVSTRLTAITSA